MRSWRSLVWSQGAICGGCRHAICVGAAPARDERPLPVLACPFHTGPTYPSHGRDCPHRSRWYVPPSRRREGDKGVSGAMEHETKQGKTE